MNADLEKAEQQLTGFAHAYQGFDIVSLIEAMALREEEWAQLRDYMPYLPEKLKDEIDLYFEKR